MKTIFKILALIITAAVILTFAACKDGGNENTDSADMSSAAISETGSGEVSQSESDNTSEPVTSSESSEISEPETDDETETEIPLEITELNNADEDKEIVALLQGKYGVKDASTGFEMIYNVAGTIEYKNEPYYFVWMRWMVTDEDGNPSHSSRLSEVLVSMDKTRIYNAFASGDTVTVYPKNVADDDLPAIEDNISSDAGDDSLVEISVDMEADIKDITDEERKDIESFMVQKHGEKDEGTGFQMSYSVNGTVEYNSDEYYLVTMRWVVQDENGNPSHLSRLGEFLVSKDKKTEYQAELHGETLTVYPSSVKTY